MNIFLIIFGAFEMVIFATLKKKEDNLWLFFAQATFSCSFYGKLHLIIIT